MRFQRSSIHRFHAWRAGRIALPVGFLAVLVAGSYLIADSGADESREPAVVRQERIQFDPYHHDVGGYDIGSLDEAGMRGLARPVASPDEVAQPKVIQRDGRPVPLLVRAIKPSAVYKPPLADHAKATPAAVHTEAAVQENLAYPVGVERFDQCKGGCDTRDPLLTPITYPAAASSEPEPASPGLFQGGLISGARQMFDRTVEGAAASTGAAYDVMKQTVSGAIDLIR